MPREFHLNATAESAADIRAACNGEDDDDFFEDDDGPDKDYEDGRWTKLMNDGPDEDDDDEDGD